MNIQIRLIATDIDGTLLDLEGDLPKINAQTLQAAHTQGVLLALSSIRKLDSAAYVAGQIGAPCLLITQGGARIYDQERTLLHEALLPLEIARAIAALADEENLPVMATVDEYNFYRPESHPSIDMRHISGGDVDSLEAALTSAPTRLIVRGQQAFERIYTQFGGDGLRFVRHFLPNGQLHDAVITHPEATKEAALAFVCARLGIEPSTVLALGDAEADIGMLQLAGVGVAVANAHSAVLEAADWIAPSAAEGGVAAAVQRFVLA